MKKAKKGLNIDVWLRNVEHYALGVYDTRYAKKEMSKEDHEALYEIHVQARRLRQKYVEE